MSPTTSFTWPWAIAQSRLLRLPRTRLSSTTISRAPSRTSRSAMCDPTRPAPPVMRQRLPRMSVLPTPPLHPPPPLELPGGQGGQVVFFLFLSEPQHACRHARRDGKVRHVGRHDGTRANDGALTHGHTGQDHRAGADVRSTPHDHRLDAEVGLDDRHVPGRARVLRAEHLRARAPAHVVLEHEVARVEVRLRADPHVVADPAGAVEPALDVRLGADEHAAADLERLHVLEAGAGADAQAVADAPAGGPPDDAPHHGVELALARREPRVEVEQAGQVVAGPEAGGQPDLELGVGHQLAQAVDRADYAFCHAGSRSVVRTSSATRSISWSASSAYMGSDSTSAAARSDTGNAPGPYPRSAYAGCRCTGAG